MLAKTFSRLFLAAYTLWAGLNLVVAVLRERLLYVVYRRL